MRIAFVSQPFDNVMPPPHCSIGIWTYEVARRLMRAAEVVIYAKGGCFWKKPKYHQGLLYQCIPVAWDYCLLGLETKVSPGTALSMHTGSLGLLPSGTPLLNFKIP